ncbi:DUF4178 domain-containing protein, partial [Myxococcota bacterium]|nr:DUF4178 domain-containing protein [Myxococcota bacterium]
MTELSVSQVDCAGCGSKIDIRTGLRAKTFTCDYCGAVCENDQVVAMQNQQDIKGKYAPMSFLRLGLRGSFLGQRYQIVGRIRLEGYEDGERWHWDEWFLMSATGFPLWLIEDEHGFSLLRIYVPTEFIDPYSPSDTVYADQKAYKIQERGFATIVFLEGEMTWRARPKETVNYIDCVSGGDRFAMEYSQNEIQYMRGQAISTAEVKVAFHDDLPAEAATMEKTPPKEKKQSPGLWIIGGIMLIAGLLALIVSLSTDKIGEVVFDESSARHVAIRSFPEVEFEYPSVNGGKNTFTITKGPVVKFQFTSSLFPYPSYRSTQEVGWWLSATLWEAGTGGNDRKIGVIDADFWRAKGYDEGESWEEEKFVDTTYVKGLKTGQKYYLTFSAS